MRIIHRNIVGGFLFSRDNKLLLGRSRTGGVYKGCWIVPGGGINKGETETEALKREIFEETGVDSSIAKVEQIEGALSGESEKVLRETQERVLVKMNFLNFKVSFPLDSDDIHTKSGDDFQDARWFTLTELQNIQLSPPTVLTLKKLGYLK